MTIELGGELPGRDLQRRVEEISGQNVWACYQCGKCSAGCPAAAAMDLLPNQVLRLVQIGLLEAALASRAIWYCAACLSCAARCPKGVDLPRVMEALRVLYIERAGDYLPPGSISPTELAGWPQQAIVAGLRKYS